MPEKRCGKRNDLQQWKAVALFVYEKTNLIILFLLFITVFELRGQEKNFIDLPYIEVTGSADSMVTPNEIYIKINLSEKDNRDRTSLEAQEKKMVDALKKDGLNTEKDLTTSAVSSNFKNYILNKNILKSKEYILKVSTADLMTKVITDLESIEISNTSIDHVDHSNMENIKNLIRSKASDNARKKATVLAKPHDRAAGTLLLHF